LNTSLSVLIPVYNAQKSLELGVCEILELLPELSPRFELCILDDGSTDDTADVAHDLAARYPQIEVIRHPIRLGLAEAIQTGLDHTQGEVVLIGSEDYQLGPDDLRTLWQLRDTERRLTGDDQLLADHERWIEKLAAWKPRRSQMRNQGFQIVRRHTFEHFRLQQALDMVRRLDRDKAKASRNALARPNFLGQVKRGVWGN